MQVMHVATEYFDKIASGSKTIESRLYDEKRKGLKVGESIEFCDAQNESRKVIVTIVGLHTEHSFSELLDKFPISKFGAENKEQMLTVLNKFYSSEDENRLGVVGIETALKL